ncbi:MAG: YitT family protein [Eggerthellaceae bacterium]|nr:YitT family protein [Eggerthellaceae bacterium]
MNGRIAQKLPKLKPLNCAVVVLSCAITAFGLFNVHSFSGITEGGLLGLTLLLDHWWGISPAITSFVASAVCYLVGWRLLGHEFMGYSIIAMVAYSGFYALFEWIGPVWPQMADMPLAACVIGAIFVGVGAGICVRAGGAQVGDDALAMGISHATGVGIQWVYLVSDLIILAASLSYIPLTRILYSLATVIISGQIIGFIQRIRLPWDGSSEPK